MQPRSKLGLRNDRRSAQPEADAIVTAEGPVQAGRNYGALRATSPAALKLAKGTTLTTTPEAPVVAFMINSGTGGSLRCQCDSRGTSGSLGRGTELPRAVQAFASLA